MKTPDEIAENSSATKKECEECEGTGQRAFAVNCPEYTQCVDCGGTGRVPCENADSPSSLTPETDAMIAADLHRLEDDETCPASAYWRMAGLTRTFERERDEWRKKAVDLHAKYAMHHAEAERMTAESIRLKCTLAKWQAWARMHGHLDHAAGIAAETRAILSPENVQGDARRAGA